MFMECGEFIKKIFSVTNKDTRKYLQVYNATSRPKTLNANIS